MSDAPRPSQDGPRRRLVEALRPRASKSQIIAALMCGLLGFALVVQLRSAEDVELDTARESDLVRMSADLAERYERLSAERDELQATRRLLEDDSSRRQAALAAARARVDDLSILAGTAPAVGPGVSLTIADPRRSVSATLMLAAVQELRDAGAEAISVDDVRVVASTDFVDVDGGIEVDGVRITPPYTVLAIGPQERIASTLAIPGGVLAMLEGADASADVTQLPRVRIDALRAPEEPQYARPAETPSDDDAGSGSS